MDSSLNLYKFFHSIDNINLYQIYILFFYKRNKIYFKYDLLENKFFEEAV